MAKVMAAAAALVARAEEQEEAVGSQHGGIPMPK